MTPEEVKALLTPFYKEMEKNIADGKFELNLKFMHPDGVVVQKTMRKAHFGTEEIAEGMKKFHAEYAAKNIKRSNEHACGCDSCLCYSCEVSFDSSKGPAKANEFHIWRKHNNEWKMYHVEYEIVPQK
ncbi:hypothetical protein Q1695_016191 [Nippostrongylus brasiliensis]|nr:hypothetical protein Q1695_016191 [Nippostrongylus brasiliensis]